MIGRVNFNEAIFSNVSAGAGCFEFGNLLIQWGQVSITPTANTPTSAAVPFSKSYAYTPSVHVTPETTVPGSTVKGWGVANESTTGFNAYVYRSNATTTVLNWIAVGQK